MSAPRTSLPVVAITCLALLLALPHSALAEEPCTGKNVLELLGGCSVLVDNDDLTVRLFPPPKANVGNEGEVRESLNRAVVFLHGYGVTHTWPPTVFYEDTRFGDFLDLNAAGLSVVGIAPGRSTADRVEDDARAVRRALEILNAYRGERAVPWVVFGHSMGALMARIALTEMELDGVDHHVSLYISYDSPHSGVHVPQGMQQLKIKMEEWVAMTEEDFIAIDSGWKGVFKLGSIDGMKNTLSPEAVGGFPDPTSYQAQQMTIQGVAFPGEYPAFMALLNDAGFPQVRSIAISNGNTRGIPNTQEIEPGEELFFFTGAKGNSIASVRGTFEVFTDRPTKHSFKSHVYYDGLARDHDGGRKDATTPADIVAMDHFSGGTLDYATQMNAAATRNRRDFHNPSYRAAKNSAIPFVTTGSAFGISATTPDSEIASLVAAGETPFDESWATGDLEGFPDNLDHNTIVLSNALLQEIHTLLPCREGIDRFGCLGDEPEEPGDGGETPNECSEWEFLNADGVCEYREDEPQQGYEDGIECSCTATPPTAALWLSLLGLYALQHRRAIRRRWN